MRSTMAGLAVLAFWFPIVAEAEVINLWCEFAPGKTYIVVDDAELDYDAGRWWMKVWGHAHEDLPEPLPKPRWWVVNIEGSRCGEELEVFEYESIKTLLSDMT